MHLRGADVPRIYTARGGVQKKEAAVKYKNLLYFGAYAIILVILNIRRTHELRQSNTKNRVSE